MAINISTLKIRALTSLIFVAVMMTGLLWNEWSFLLLFIVIHAGCWIEFIGLVKRIYGTKHLGYTLLGLLYITLPICLMIDLRMNWSNIMAGYDQGGHGNTLPLAIILSIWVNDTMAYLVGSVIGRTPFSSISPKKTWEGTIGGAILSVVVMGYVFPLLSKSFFYHGFHQSVYFLLAAICAITGTAGDLLESKLKRMANVKDSGAIMPGHGGFLDRFDSLLVAIPFAWLFIKLFV